MEHRHTLTPSLIKLHLLVKYDTHTEKYHTIKRFIKIEQIHSDVDEKYFVARAVPLNNPPPPTGAMMKSNLESLQTILWQL